VIEDHERLALRLLAFGGLWLLLSGLLLVLSFVVVALVAFAALFSVVIAIGAVLAVRRLELEERLWTLLASATEAGQWVGRRLRKLGVQRRVRRLGTRARRTAAGVPVRANARARRTAARVPARTSALLARALQTYAIAIYRVRTQTARRIHAGRRSQALQLNELGAELRRRGAPEEAAEQHRVALEIARDLGDDQAEALTLNSLALALAQGGAEAEAVEHLEQARVVLRELGDEKHEAQVIANLGIVYRRQGNSEEAVSLLHEALHKLAPGSWAYRQVEEELSRAS
jgi:tetratricopeptide (TPR) repeat protein